MSKLEENRQPNGEQVAEKQKQETVPPQAVTDTQKLTQRDVNDRYEHWVETFPAMWH